MLMLTFTCLKIEGCLPVWCQLKLVPLGVKIVLIIKQLDSYNALLGRCALYSSLCKYLLPNKINNAAVMGSSKDDASGHYTSLVGMRLSRQLQCILCTCITNGELGLNQQYNSNHLLLLVLRSQISAM